MALKGLFKKTKLPSFLILVLLLAFIVRVVGLIDTMFFGFEQGRDLIAVSNILKGDPALVGAPTSIPGFFHGVLFYLVLIPPFVLFSGNPLFIQISLILLNVFSLLFLFEGIKNLFSKKAAYLGVVLVTFSYSSIIFSRWFSNPTLLPAVFNLLFFSMVRAKKNPRFLVLAVIAWGFMFHFQSLVAVTLIPAILVFIKILKIRTPRRVLAASFLTVSIFLFPYLIFDLRNDFIMSQSLIDYFGQQNTRDRLEIINRLYATELQRVIFPGQQIVSVFIFFVTTVLAFKLPKRRIIFGLYFFLTSVPLLFVLIGKVPDDHYLILTHLVFYTILATVWSRSKSAAKAITGILIAIALIGNIGGYVNKVVLEFDNYLYPNQYTYLGNQLELVDYIYKDAEAKPFSYDYFTVPYWKSEGWEYLFSWYGEEKHGYLPEKDRTEVFYVVIEPDDTQPQMSRNWYKDLNAGSTLLDYKVVNNLLAEKRIEGNKEGGIEVVDFYERFKEKN